MNAQATQPAISPSHQQLRARCEAVGLPTWRFGAEGRLLDSPGGSGIVARLMRSPYLSSLASRRVSEGATGGAMAPAELFPGCWMIAIEETSRRRRVGAIAGVLFEPRAMETEEFAAACQSAQLDRLAAGSAVAALAMHSPGSVRIVAALLGFASEDLLNTARSDAAASSSGQQLTELYEEIALLYKLGKSMNQLVHPEQFVRTACAELHETMNFRWIGAKFLDDPRFCRAMTGKLIVSGDLPCVEAALRAEAGLIVESLTDQKYEVLQGERLVSIASSAGQVLVQPIVRNGAVIGGLFAGGKHGSDPCISNVDIKLMEAAAGYIGTLLDNAFLYDDQQILFLGVVEALTASIDAKDPYTCGHSERVSHLAALLAGSCGLNEEEVERIRIAGLVHDIGKIGVPEAVLCKAGKLTDEEFGLIKLHPEIGYDILKDIPLLSDVLPGVLHHHERYDGRGYPHRLGGEAIPMMARIIGLVDSFDAMSSNRTYRGALPRAKVLDEIRRNAGTQFDPALAERFLCIDLYRYDELVQQHHEGSLQGGLRTRRRSIAGLSSPSAAPGGAGGTA